MSISTLRPVIGKKYRVIDAEERNFVGKTATFREDDGTECPWFDMEDGAVYPLYFYQIEELEKDMFNLAEGDVLTDGLDKNENRKVLGVIHPGLYVLSMPGGFHRAGSTYLAEELIKKGLTCPIADPVEAVEEMTVDQISEALGKKVKVVGKK